MSHIICHPYNKYDIIFYKQHSNVRLTKPNNTKRQLTKQG